MERRLNEPYVECPCWVLRRNMQALPRDPSRPFLSSGAGGIASANY